MKTFTIKLYGKSVMTLNASSFHEAKRRLAEALQMNEDLATMDLDDFEIEG